MTIHRWQHKVKGVQTLVRNGNPANFKEIARQIHAKLRELPNRLLFHGFDLSRFLKVESVAELDSVLDVLYDFCDAKRIWLELD